MSCHIGSVGSKVSAEVKLVNTFEYVDYKFSYGGTTHYTYIMHDAEGNVLVWKTTSSLMFDWIDTNGNYQNDIIRKGDTMLIEGKVKEHSEYKGVKQTILTRCKFSLVCHAPTKEELDAQRSAQQMQSLNDGDFVWEMPYTQYKEHYADCETVAGSYDDKVDSRGFQHGHPTIKVIIREGRLKASGVRGMRFHRFRFRSVETEPKSGEPYGITIRAVSEENARKQLAKDPETKGYTWELFTIYK